MEIVQPVVGRAVTYGFKEVTSVIPLYLVDPGDTDSLGNRLLEPAEARARSEADSLKALAASRDSDEVFFDVTRKLWVLVQRRTVLEVKEEE